MIVALHGFLGTPNDWKGILPNGSHAVDLFNDFEVPSGDVLLGYSLGGRLALQELDRDPSRWKAAVIISANPGLATEDEKQARVEHDERWAKRFENDPWDEVIRDWNSQPVFSGNVLVRKECDYDRKRLCRALREWSLGKQRTIDVKKFNFPIMWMTGEKDIKFRENYQLSHEKSKSVIVPDAGHRVPWENTLYFQQQLHQFLGDIQ